MNEIPALSIATVLDCTSTVDWCRHNANSAPIWEEQSGSVVVTFHPVPGFTGEVTAQDTTQVAKEVARLLPLAICARPRFSNFFGVGT
jgi:hypothetical protein